MNDSKANDAVSELPAKVAPPELTESYQKARRSYTLFSALLLAWELIGVELQGVPVADVNVTLKTPEAAPLVLLALVAYFSARFMLEWAQVDAGRKKVPAARLDFAYAHVIALHSVAVFLYQTLAKTQLVSLATLTEWSVMGMFAIAGTSIQTSHSHLITRRGAANRRNSKALLKMSRIKLLQALLTAVTAVLLAVAQKGASFEIWDLRYLVALAYGFILFWIIQSIIGPPVYIERRSAVSKIIIP